MQDDGGTREELKPPSSDPFICLIHASRLQAS